ncbi:carbon-nitrogen hydrolase family protein [Pseudomonas sp. KNUC1026]|uniref:carbon-nitrogen hydrolase family protein n=1 Tax=Pseudomonas sp. KNUC1026 TaxID=2893890 RepID=UPI001F32DF0B|nr:carbon-nitrogen hydrolase family protein [Pseudomonas sp. KNUC1026]UFH50588.1 carbon-nitrogen hydrolase family protein [Pseudomonas sp. KNUC1026]
MLIAAARTRAVARDLAANLQAHVRLMHKAHALGVRLLVFPELSLTGYEPEAAAALALDQEDEALRPLRELAERCEMVCIVGAPLRTPGAGKPVIAAWIFGLPGGPQVYGKQHLHPGEERFFSAGQGGAGFTVGELPVALAVCADFSHASHPAAAAAQGAGLYAVSALVSEGGYGHDSELLAGYARQHRMPVLLANHGGESGGWHCAGRSALWDAEGRCVSEVPGPGEALLPVEISGGLWRALPVVVLG